MKTESKTLKLKILPEDNELRADDDESGMIYGYASTFGGEPDAYGDIIAKGAFKRTLNNSGRGRSVKFLWQHRQDEPIGIPEEIREDSKGLLFKARLADTTRARDAYELVKMGAIDGLSIGFRAIKYDIDADTSVRTLTEIALHEVSLVTFEANTNAKIFDVKSERDVIRGLIDAGYTEDSAVEAVKYLSLQDSGPHLHPDDGPDSSEESEAANRLMHSLDSLIMKMKS